MKLTKGERVEVLDLYGYESARPFARETWRIGLIVDGPGESHRGRCWLVKVGGQDPQWYYEDEIREPKLGEEFKPCPKP